MKYTKPSLTFTEQADQLLALGMVTAGRETLITHLGNVSYYRLSCHRV
jgi:abortive infection bacteriophage resistance protein